MDTVTDDDERVDYPVAVAPATPRDIPIEAARLLMPGGEYREVGIVEGWTIAQLVEGAVPEGLRGCVHVYCNGTTVAEWAEFYPRAGDRILLTVVPQGGGDNSKGIIGAVLAIAIAVFVPYAVGLAGGALTVGGVSGAALSGLGMAVSAGITMVGTMVLSALIAPASVNTGNITAASPRSYTLTGQSNQGRPFSACFVIYGRHKVMPAMAANPNIDNWGNSSQMTMLYDFGLGWVDIDDLRIGDVSAWQYQPATVWHQNSFCQDLRLLTVRIGYDQYAINLAQNEPEIVRTKINTISADLDIQFQRGIFQAAPKFGAIPFWADFAAYWRPVGGSTWQEVPIDWYYGAANREYTSSVSGNVLFALYEVPPGTVYRYDPATSPAVLRSLDAAYRQQQRVPNVYIQSVPNPNFVFSYPDGPINEPGYFARYPEIRAAGWYDRSAQDHFESIGSREGRDPGVRVLINRGFEQVTYDRLWTPSSLYNDDWLNNQERPLVGGWGWIKSGAALPVLAESRPPFSWGMEGGAPFESANYLERYPDVAASGQDPWTHFINYGAFEGRDPYKRVTSRSVRLTAMWVGPYWVRINFQFPTPGEYELQVMRTDKIEDGTDNTINVTSGGAVTARFNESTVALLRSYEWGAVVQPRLRHSMLEMRVTATDQLQGVIQNFSAIATSVLRVAWFDGTTGALTFSYAQTRNPAWIALDIITSERNPKPLKDDQIDWPSWVHLAWICDTPRSWVANGMPFTAPRFTCDIVVESFMTVKELVESVLAAARSSLTLTTAGLWGVLHDEEKTTPRQVLTPANSWGFSGSRAFTPQPHCLRVNYINRDNGWIKDELPVYADGYWSGNATEYETLDTFGVTDYPHAWAYGRYMLAQGLQRSELFTVSLDVENLLVQRGDMVYVAHDVPRVGGMPSRVVDYGWAVGPNGGGVLRVSQPLPYPPSGYSIRRNDGSVLTGHVLSALAADVVEVDNLDGVNVDDLVVLGEYDRVTQPYLVQRISPGADLTAELTLCKYAPGVYTADIGALPPWEPGFGQDYVNGTDLVCANATATQRLYYVEREPRVDVLLQWTTTGFAFDHHEIALIMPSGLREAIAGPHKPQNFQWVRDALRQRTYFDVLLQFEITPVSTLGFRGVPAYVSIVLVPDRTAPAPVTIFGANVQKEHIDLFWDPPQNEPDVASYLIRYTPVLDVPNWDASQQLATIGWPNTKTSAGARTGAYGLRVVDTSGNQSPVVWRRTTIALLPDINVITVMNDRFLVPPWPGKLWNAKVVGTEVMTAGDFGNVAPLAYYYCKVPVDLGDVFEVRISSKIESYGVTANDYMASWVTLAEVPSLVSATSDLWNAWLEVSGADEMLFMSQWDTLEEIDPIAADDDSEWSPWRAVTVGDFTARLLRFRIVMQSNNPGVRVVTRSGRIEVDMPDRIDAYGDVDVPPAGLDFVFPVAFRHLEAVAITINGNDEPVVAEVTDKDPEGFHVVLRNTQTGALTDGYIDILAQGYGRLRPLTI
jgi:hypothetical protein